MKHLYYKILSFFNVIKSNIAFYPTILAILGFGFSLLMILLEKEGISKYLLKILPILVVENGNTALSVLSACVGGLISMMVFSFSMVMLLLSQASSNYSPRILPGLISDKRHQIILGIFLATILYIIFTMFNIQPTGEKYTLPGFSVLLGIVMTVLSLCSFIYFINNISQSIQISNILDKIYKDARERLEHILEQEATHKTIVNFEDTKDWHAYKTVKSGYFQNLSSQNLLTFCKDNDTKLFLAVPKGLYVRSNDIFFKSEKELNKEQLDSFYDNINFLRKELVSNNYGLAFKQITEIAVKAMSPGINDPGTALNAIDYLTELFALRMKKEDLEIYVKEDIPYYKVEMIPFKILIYNVMASLRTYSKKDPSVVQKLLYMLNYLLEQPAYKEDYRESIHEEIKLLKRDSEALIAEFVNVY